MRIALVGVFTILTFLHCVSQDSLSKFDRFVSLPSKFFQNVNRSAAKFEQKLYSNTDAVLNKLYQQEKKLSRKLRKKDPFLAQKLFSETDSIYSSLKSKISERQLSENLREDHYVPFLDTIRTTYRFLGKNSEQFPNINSKELSDAMLQIQAL